MHFVSFTISCYDIRLYVSTLSSFFKYFACMNIILEGERLSLFSFYLENSKIHPCVESNNVLKRSQFEIISKKLKRSWFLQTPST